MKILSISKLMLFSIFSIFFMNIAICEEGEQKESPISTTPASISSITMALGTFGVELEPSNQTDFFKPTDTIHAIVRVINAPAGTKLSASWFVVDVGSAAEPNSLILSTDITVEGTKNVDFTLDPSNSFPVGTYQVEISINGKLDTTKIYSVKP